MTKDSKPQGAERSRQSASQGGASRDSSAGSSQLSGSTDSANTDNTGRAGAQTGGQLGNEQYDDVGNQRLSNDSAGGLPRSPGGSRMSAEQDMNDDTGLSNSANRQEVDMGTKQEQQSNVGRRSDMTPD
ncbi:MAG TPA: hypothetical protein VFT37_12920 [Telluria sp.]|nr:hypothetical protein [Telluria sp.]